MRAALVLLALAASLPLLAQEGDAEHIARLVRQLGSDDYAERDAAVRELRAMGKRVLPALQEAAQSDDAEIRERALDLLPRVRWNLGDDCPGEVHALLAEYETADAGGRANLLRKLASTGLPAARKVLYSAWWEVDDAGLIADLATELIGVDTDIAEDRLRALEGGGDPRILRALSQARALRGDDSEAADLFGRVVERTKDASLFGPWMRMLMEARRYEDVVRLVRQQKAPDPEEALLAAESSYCLGRRDEAEEILRGFVPTPAGEPKLSGQARGLAFRYGSARLFIGGAEAEEHLARERDGMTLAVRAWIQAGDLERAEAALRRIENGATRADLLGEVLGARGDLDLLTPAFLAEAGSPQQADAARHRRLAKEWEARDADVARAEWKKAVFLDPSLAKEAPPAQAGTPGAGCRPICSRALPDSLAFASSPTQIGDFWYYANCHGDLLKVRDPLAPEPVWTYHPPLQPRSNWRGWASGYQIVLPAVTRWEGKIVALYGRRWSITVPHGNNGSSSSGSPSGAFLCVVDENTGREEWSHAFPGEAGGRVFPDAGIVVFATGGPDVFDLKTRAWRWSISIPDQAAGAIWADVAAWAHGDAVYVGLATGALCRLRAADGSLVWRREWPCAPGACSLQAAGNQLLFTAGERIVCLSLEDDSVRWEAVLPPNGGRGGLLVDGERAYFVASWEGSVCAVSLADGKVCWQSRRRLTDYIWDQGLMNRVVYLAANDRYIFLDKATGAYVGAAPHAGQGVRESPIFSRADTLYESNQSPFGLDRHPGPDDPRVSRRDRQRPELAAIRVIPGPTPTGAFEPPKDEDPLARVSLLEDLCGGSRSRDRAAWLALAEEELHAGRADRAAEAALEGLLVSDAGADEVHAWCDRVGAAGHGARGAKDAAAALHDLDRRLAFEKAILAGGLPSQAADPERPWPSSFLDLMREGSREVVSRRAVALVREGISQALPVVVEGLPDMDDREALDAIAGIVRMTVLSGDESRVDQYVWLQVQRSGSCCLRDALRGLLARKRTAVPGAALAALLLLDETAEAEGAEALLRSAFGEKDPIVRLAAAAALAKRGAADAKKAVLEAIGSADQEERTVAVVLAGRLRLAEAVDVIRLDGETSYGAEPLALVAIGTDAAAAKLLAWARDTRSQGGWAVPRAMGRWGSPKAVEILVAMTRSEEDYQGAQQAIEALRSFDTTEARRAIMDYSRDYLHLDPDGVFAMRDLANGCAAEGDVKGAEECLAQLEARVSPVWWLEETRTRVLAAKGDLDAARQARRRAEEGLLRGRAICPSSRGLLVDEARLYLDPEAIADKAKARDLLEQARTLAPPDAEILGLLERAGGKR